MNKQVIKYYINEYKDKFEYVNQQEIYKWKAVKQFQDNWNIDATDFYSMLENSLKLVDNLLDSGQYFPKRMLFKNTEATPEKIRTLFKYLFDENYDIYERIDLFRSDFKKINQENFVDLKDYQDHRAIIVYLTLQFPDRYYFYKQRMFKAFTDIIDYRFKPVAGRIENIGQYQTLCSLLKHELAKDQELLKLHKNRISEDCYYDESLNILTQDFIYAVVVHLKPAKISTTKEAVILSITKVKSSEIENIETSIDFTPKTVNYIQNNIENKRIGDLGELWVIEYEKQKLIQANKQKLAEKISHISKAKGDGLGYDILSYDLNGNKIFIEVKTTKKDVNTTFYITRNELERSRKEKDMYLLYRVYNFDEKTEKGELLIIKGDLSNLCNIPLTYKVNIKQPVGNSRV